MLAGGAAKLNDFGIARSADDASLTQTGLVTGSPAYLAPEVASGSSATPASDVWSLGATLYHAVTGKPPYDVGDNLIGALYKIVHEDPPRLPDGHPMAGLLTVMMNRDTDARWSMPRVRDELTRIARGQRSTAVAAPHTAPAREQTGVLPAVQPVPPARAPRDSRMRWGWVAAAAVLAVAAVVTAYVLAGRETPEAQPDRTTSSAQASETTTDTPQVTAEDTRQQMDAFITSYISTVTSDPRAAFEQLTPEFQQRERRLRRLHELVGQGAVRLRRGGPQRPLGPHGGLHRRLRDEVRRPQHPAGAVAARALRRPAAHRRRGLTAGPHRHRAGTGPNG